MSNPKLVLVPGGSGRLGEFIVQAILNKNPDVHVRVLGRKLNEEAVKKGNGRVSSVVADLSKPDVDLSGALAGVDAIVSAVIGDDAIVVAGQKRLIDAAKKAGTVKQFIPSSFSLDYRQAARGLHPNWDQRKEVDDYLIASGIPYTIINQGCFPEVLFIPGFHQVLNIAERKVSYWGDDEDWKIEWTTYEDTGKIVAESLYDSWALNRHVTVHGDKASPRDLVNYFKELTGEGHLVRLGSIAELEASIKQAWAEQQPMKAIIGLYAIGIFQYRSPAADSDRFHDKIKFTTVKEALAGVLKDTKAWTFGPKTFGM